MKITEKTLAFDKHLWVQFDGVAAKEAGGELKLTARDEEAYLKVFNHFGRLLKLFIFEDGKWVDADTGLAAKPFDESQAGRLPDAPPGTKKIGAKKKDAKGKATKKIAAKPAVKNTAEKKAATKENAATKAKAPARKTKSPTAGKKTGGKAKAAKK